MPNSRQFPDCQATLVNYVAWPTSILDGDFALLNIPPMNRFVTDDRQRC